MAAKKEKVILEISPEELDTMLIQTPSLVSYIKKRNAAAGYKKIKSCEPFDSDKKIIFKFESGVSFVYCMINKKFQTIEKNGSYSDIKYHECLAISDEMAKNKDLFHLLAEKSTGWVKKFFCLIRTYIFKLRRTSGTIFHYDKLTVIVPSFQTTECKTFEESNVSLCERFSKDIRFEKWSHEDLSSVFESNLINDKNINKLFDNWFLSHATERSNAAWELEYDDNDIEDIENGEFCDLYSALDDDEFLSGGEKLLRHAISYLYSKENGMEEAFKYAWEKYKVSIAYISNNYRLEGFRERGVCEVFDILEELVLKRSYEPKRLIDYLFTDLKAQGIILCNNNFQETLIILRDYVRMNVSIEEEKGRAGGKYEKYPKYLKTAHDIAMRNFLVQKSQSLKKQYSKKVYEEVKSFEFKKDGYVVIAPKTINEITKEGAVLNHCVASYITSVVNRETNILFLRKEEDINKSLVTLEVKNNHVVQAKGQSNRNTEKEEKDFLKIYSEFLKTLTKRNEKATA